MKTPTLSVFFALGKTLGLDCGIWVLSKATRFFSILRGGSIPDSSPCMGKDDRPVERF
jgi:hypothetical protein